MRDYEQEEQDRLDHWINKCKDLEKKLAEANADLKALLLSENRLADTQGKVIDILQKKLTVAKEALEFISKDGYGRPTEMIHKARAALKQLAE